MKAKNKFLAIAACSLMAFGAMGAQAAEKDIHSQIDRVNAGLSGKEVTTTLGKPDSITVVSDKTVWEYRYEKEVRFAPDIEGVYQVQFNNGQVDRVFHNEVGLGLWAMVGVVFLAVVFI